MRKPARSIWGYTRPSPARLPIDCTHPMVGPPIETSAVLADQDGTLSPLADGQIDGCGPYAAPTE
jgi:hypothetical protein